MPDNKTPLSPLQQAQLIASQHKPLNPLQDAGFDPSQSAHMSEDEFATYNKYGSFYNIGDDNEERRAYNQPLWEDAKYGTARLLGTGATKALSGFGYLGAMANPFNWGDGYMDKVLDNSWSALWDNAEEGVKEAFPIYKTKQYQNGNIGQQMLTSEFWSDDFVDGLAFMLSTYVPGGALAKVGVGAKMAEGYGALAKRFSSLYKAAVAGEKVAPNLKRIADMTNKAQMWGTMTAMEAAFEAKDSKDQIYDAVYNKLINEGYSEDEASSMANQQASDKAKDVFALNMLALAPSNLLELGAVYKLAGKGTAKAEGIAINNALEATDSFSKLKGLDKWLKGYTAQGLKGFAAGAGSEGFYEENIQHSIQELTKAAALELDDNSFMNTLSAIPNKMVDNLSDKEGQKAIALGAILGSFGGAASQISEKSSEDKKRKEYIAAINNGLNTYKEKNNIYQTEEITNQDGTKTTKLKLDENNNPIVDEAKLSTVIGTTNKLNDLQEIATWADSNNKPVLAELMRSEAFNTLVNIHLAAGTIDDFKTQLKAAGKLKPEELAEMGIVAEDNDVATTIANKLTKVDRLEKLYKSIDGTVYQEGKNASEKSKIQERKNFLFNSGARLMNVKEQLDKTQSKIASLSAQPTMANLPHGLGINQLNDHKVNLLSLKNLYAELERVSNDPTSTQADITEINNKIAEKEQQVKDNKQALKDQLEFYKGNSVLNDKQRDEIEKTMSDLDSDEELITNPKYKNDIDLEIELARKAELQNSYELVGEKYEKVLDPTKGQKYFNDNQSALKVDVEATAKPDIKKTDAKKYQTWEKGMMRKMRLKLLKDKATNKYKPDTLIEKLTNVNNYSDLLQLFNELKYTGALINPDVYFAFDKAIFRLKDAIVSNDMDTAQEAFDEGDMDTFNELKAKHKLSHVEDAYFVTELEKQADKLDDLSDDLENYTGQDIEVEVSDAEVRQALANEWIDNAIYIEQQSADDNFTDSDAVADELENLKSLKTILESHDNKGDFKNQLAEIARLIPSLEALLKLTEQRKADREAKLKRIYENAVTEAYNSLGVDYKSKSVVNKDLHDKIFKIIEDTLDSAVVDKLKNNYELVYADLVKQLLSEAKKANPDTTNDLEIYIESQIAKLVEDMFNIPVVANMTHIAEEKAAYAKAPQTVFEMLVNYAGDRTSNATTNEVGFDLRPDSAIFKFLQEKELIPFLEDAEKQDRGSSKLNKDELVAMIKVQQQILALHNLRTALNTDYGVIKELSTELSLLEGNKDLMAPSTQQLLSLRQLVGFYQSTSGSNVAYMRGYAGVGKSTIMKMYVKLLGLKPDEVMTIGHSKESAKNIANMVGNNNPLTIDQVLGKPIPPTIKLVLIDEAPGIDGDLLLQFFDEVKDKKIVTLGDPNQKVTNNPVLDNLKTSFVNIIRPLTIRYRSNINAVVEFQDKFLERFKFLNDDSSIKVKSNTNDPATHTGELLGVNTTRTSQEFERALDGIHTNSNFQDGKRRAIITTPAMVQYYKDKYSQFEVLTVEQAQGATIDEVYVDIPQYGNAEEYNSDMFTATSRAVTYVLVNNMSFTNIKSDIDKGISKIDQLEKDKNELIDKLKADIKLLEDLGLAPIIPNTQNSSTASNNGTSTSSTTTTSTSTGTTTVTDEENEDEYEEEIDEEEVGEEEVEVTEEEVITSVPAGDTNLAYPTSESLKDATVNGNTLPPIQPGDEVLYIAEQYAEGEYRITVLAPTAIEGKYRQVAVLSDDELNNPPAGLENVYAELRDKKDKVATSNTSTSYEGNILSLDKTEVDKATLYKASIGETNKLTYTYKLKDAMFNFADIISKFIQSMFPIGIKDADKKAITNNAEVRVLNSKEASKLGLAKGVPYIIFQKMDAKGKSKKQYIRLSPRKLNANDHHNEVNHILRFKELINNIEGQLNRLHPDLLLGNPTFNRLINLIGKNADEDTINKFLNDKGISIDKAILDSIRDMAKEAHDLVYEPKKTLQDTLHLQGKYVQSKTNPYIKTLPNGEQKPVGVIIDSQVRDASGALVSVVIKDHSGQPITITGTDINDLYFADKSTAGPAQKQFNAIANANLMANGVVLRTYIYEAGGLPKSKGKSLLTEHDPLEGLDLTNSAELTKILMSTRGSAVVTRMMRRVGLEAKTEQDKIDYLNNLLQSDPDTFNNLVVSLVSNVDSKGLNRVFSFDANGNSEAQGGFGLRVPVKMSTFGNGNKVTDNDILNYYFENNFNKVNPTKITIRHDKGNAPKPAASTTTQSQQSSDIDDIDLDDMPDIKYKTVDGILKGNKLKEKQILAYLKKRIPGFNPENLKLLTGLDFIRVGKDKAAWGRWIDGVIELAAGVNTEVHEVVLRHEILHEIFGKYLTNKERTALYNYVRGNVSKLKNASDLDIEEYLAEGYETFKPKGFVAKIWDKIKEFFGFITENVDVVQDLYNKIEEGYFKVESTEQLDGERLKSVYLEEFGSVDTYNAAKSIYLFVQDRLLNPKGDISEIKDDKGNVIGLNNVPRNRAEALKDFINYVTKQAIAYKKEYDNGVFNSSSPKYIKMLALQALSTKNEKGRYNAIELIYKDLYPTTKVNTAKLKASAIIKVDEEVVVINEEDKMAFDNRPGKSSVSDDYIKESDAINHLTKQSQAVKDFLSTIIDSNGKLVKAGHAYLTLARALYNVPTENLDELYKFLNKKLKDNGELNKPSIQAILKHLKDNVLDVILKSDYNGVNVANIEQIKGHKFTYSLNNDIVFSLGNVIIPKGDRSMSEWFIAIKSETGIDYNLLRFIYQREAALEVLRNMVSNMGSLREKNPMFAIKGFGKEFNGFQYKYKPFKQRVEKSIYSDNLKSQLDVNFEAVRGYAAELGQNLTSSSAIKLTLINEILKDKLHVINSNLTFKNDADIDSVYNALSALISSLNTRVKSEEKTDAETGEKFLDVTTVQDVLENHSGNIAVIASALDAKFDINEKPSMYHGGNGEMKWFMMLASYASDVIHSIIDSAYSNKFDTFDSTFFENSIYNSDNKIGKIHSLVDHDSIKNDNAKYRAVEHKGESPAQWLERNFSAAFASMLQEGGNKYVQFFYTISNKPNILGAEVDLLGDKDIDKAIEKAILQEANRPTVEQANNKAYTETKRNTTLLPGLDKVYTPEELKDKAVMKAAVAKVKTALEAKAIDMANNLIKEKTSLPGNLASIQSLVKGKIANKYATEAYGPIEHIVATEEGEKLPFSKRTFRSTYAVELNEIIPMVDLFYKNYYMQSLFLNQLVMGDRIMFKDEYDEIKRMSIAFGQGMRGFVNDKYGIPTKFRVGIMEDLARYIGDDFFKQFEKVMGKKFEMTDGQGFSLPEWHESLVKGYGQSMNLSLAKKPVYYGVDEYGVPRSLKYSTIVLTKELCDMFPGLGKLRDAMRNAEGGPIQEAVFASAVKTGKPRELAKFNEQEGAHTEFKSSSILTLDSKNYRIQLNPKADLDSYITHPSQLMYFLNTNGLNLDKADLMYKIAGFNTKNNSMWFKQEMDLFNIKRRTVNKLKQVIAEGLKTQSNAGLQYELTADKNISFNFPTVANKIYSSFASLYSKNSTEHKASGTKLVLQSAYGTDSYSTKILSQYGLSAPKIVNTPNGFVAECYLPDIGGLREKLGITDDKFFSNEELSVMLGFRLPSTELHSALPVKVKGFYPATSNENIIIAPAELVFLHGSDFDVDSLYVMRKEILSLKNPLRDWKTGKLLIQPNSVIGYDRTGKKIQFKDDDGNNVTLSELIEQRINEGYALFKNENASKEDKDKFISFLEFIKANNSVAGTVYNDIVNNDMVDIFLSVIRDKKNLEFMMKPISMEEFSGATNEETAFDILAKYRGFEKEKPTDAKQLEDWKEERDNYIKPKRDLNDPIDQMGMHQDNHSGSLLTGIFANAIKAVAYLYQSASKTEEGRPMFSNGIKFKYGNTTYDGFNRTATNDNTKYVWETLDALVNAAIDNVKEQILNVINATNNTGKIWVSLVATGLPQTSVTRIMTNKLVTTLIKEGNFEANLNSTLKDYKVKLITDQGGQVSKETLDKVTEELRSTNLSDELLDNLYFDKSDNVDLYNAAVLQILFDMNKVGGTISTTSRLLGVLRQLPAFYTDVESLMQDYDSMFNETSEGIQFQEGYPFTNTKLLEVPHIKQAIKELKVLKSKSHQMWAKHNKNLIEFVNRLSNKFKIKLDSDSNVNSQLIREEFISYILANVSITSNGEKLDFDTTNEEPYEFNRYGKSEYKTNVTGTHAWAQRFIDKVQKLKSEIPGNSFLAKITIHTNKDGLRYLMFKGATLLNDPEREDYRKWFVSLPTSIQNEFLKYTTLIDGLKFGANNLNAVLPMEIFHGISKALDAKFGYVFGEGKMFDEDNTTTMVNNLEWHFALQLAYNNAESIDLDMLKKFSASQIKVNGKPYGVARSNKNNPVDYQLAYKITEENGKDDYGNYPYIVVKQSKDRLHILLKLSNNIKLEDGTPIVAYQKIGTSKGSLKSYQFNDAIAKFGYKVDNFFDPNFIVRKLPSVTPVNNKLQYTPTKAADYPIGTIIHVTSSSDITRYGMLKTRVESVNNGVYTLDVIGNTNELGQDDINSVITDMNNISDSIINELNEC